MLASPFADGISAGRDRKAWRARRSASISRAGVHVYTAEIEVFSKNPADDFR